jgi:ABC-2 type transport system permease protein
MNGGITTRLIMKDLYMHRRLIAVAVVLGIASLLVASINRVSFSVGGTLYLTTVIAYGVVLVMSAVVQERKDKSALFVLSLPISGDDYLRAKVLAVLATFVVPWLALSLGAISLFAFTPMSDGFIPFLVLVSVFMLMNFTLVLVTALLTVSEPAITAAIILTNVSVSLFFIFLGSRPAIHDHLEGPVAVWNEAVFVILAVEIAVILTALTLSFWLRRGRSVLI